MDHGSEAPACPARSTLMAGTLLLCAAMLGGPATSAFAGDTMDTREQIESMLDAARSLLRSHKAKDALPLLRKADHLSKGTCDECLLQLSAALYEMGRPSDAIDAASRLIAREPEKRVLIAALNQLALGLLHDGKPKPEELQQAEAAYRRALELAGGRETALRFNLAKLLLRTARVDEGFGMLREIMSENPSPDLGRRIRLLLEDPTCADDRCAPEFAFATTAGEYLSREDLKGKAVLLYFWLTQCPVADCPDSSRTLNRLGKKQKDEPVVVVAISSDSSAATLEELRVARRLEYSLYHDESRQLAADFGIHWFPAAAIVDHRGRIAWRSLILSDEQREEMDRRTGRAIKNAREAATDHGEGSR